jgi:ATP-dependent Clp protease ATP-binding subunit ClpX
MLDIMYDIPTKTMVKEVVINDDVIYNREKPIIVYENVAESA